MNKNISIKLTAFFTVLIAFLIDAPLRFLINSAFPNVIISRVIPVIIIYIAMILCILISVKPFIKTVNVFKAIAAVLVFAVLDSLLSRFALSLIIALIYQILRPALLAVIFVFAFRMITKRRVTMCKPIAILIVCVFAVGTVCSILQYIFINSAMQYYQGQGNDLFSYLNLLSPSSGIISYAVSACLYILLFLVTLLCINQTTDL